MSDLEPTPPSTYVDPRPDDDDVEDTPVDVAAVLDGPFARIPPHLRIVFSDELAQFREDLTKQINGAFAALGRRIERRVEKKVGDRAEAIVVAALKKAGLAPKGLL